MKGNTFLMPNLGIQRHHTEVGRENEGIEEGTDLVLRGKRCKTMFIGIAPAHLCELLSYYLDSIFRECLFPKGLPVGILRSDLGYSLSDSVFFRARIRGMFASSGVRLPLRRLQFSQLQTVFVHEFPRHEIEEGHDPASLFWRLSFNLQY